MLAEAVAECLDKVRLHLGCGSRLFDGYINVDGAYMRGTAGVVIHDITEPLPLGDNTVDEILSVHVIEHIMRDRVQAMIKEWHRVLKPNGFVAVEWPDFLKMCQAVVNNPDCLNFDADRKLQKRTIAGIFGDNLRYPDPVMWHKWGYSADSLSYLFLHHGFTKVKTEPNLHGKTASDSRVVAFK
jgi:SAM-dependent methyltransferase